MLIKILQGILTIPVLLLILHTLIRVVRYFYKFPMPEWMADFIDNPMRRKLQPPGETAIRHEIEPGMRVLEVGPGNGTYTLGAARRIGPTGQLVTIDIEPKMIARVEKRLAASGEGIANIDARVANVYELPFEDGSFDLVYMIAAINEIPDIPQALAEFRRVLKPDGKLVFSELIMDPDYPLASTLTRTVEAGGYRLRVKKGNFLYYTLIFLKSR